MRTIKALFTALAVTAISAALAVSVSADKVTLEADAYNNETGVITATDYTTTSGQMTVIVVEASVWDNIGTADITSDDLLYINQFDAADAEETLSSIGLRDKLVEDTEYYVLLGGENATDIQVLSITYTEEGPVYKWGDVNEDTVVDSADSQLLSRHTIPIELLAMATEDPDKFIAICDINKDGVVDSTDSQLLSRHTIPIELIPGM